MHVRFVKYFHPSKLWFTDIVIKLTGKVMYLVHTKDSGCGRHQNQDIRKQHESDLDLSLRLTQWNGKDETINGVAVIFRMNVQTVVLLGVPHYKLCVDRCKLANVITGVSRRSVI